MAVLHRCVNCGDHAPDAWLCPTCENLKQQVRQRCFENGHYWGHQVNAAVYAALTEYRERKQGAQQPSSVGEFPAEAAALSR